MYLYLVPCSNLSYLTVGYQPTYLYLPTKYFIHTSYVKALIGDCIGQVSQSNQKSLEFLVIHQRVPFDSFDNPNPTGIYIHCSYFISVHFAHQTLPTYVHFIHLYSRTWYIHPPTPRNKPA